MRSHSQVQGPNYRCDFLFTMFTCIKSYPQCIIHVLCSAVPTPYTGGPFIHGSAPCSHHRCMVHTPFTGAHSMFWCALYSQVHTPFTGAHTFNSQFTDVYKPVQVHICTPCSHCTLFSYVYIPFTRAHPVTRLTE